MSNYPPYPPYPYPPPPQYAAPPQTHTMAIVSLIFGILGITGVCAGLGPIIALICGNMALGEIRANPAHYTGEGLAKAGIIMGWIGIVIMGLVLCAVIASFILPILLALLFSAAEISSLHLPLLPNYS